MLDPARDGMSREAAIVMANLRVDAATAEVLRAFQAASVQTLLLKGASLARWLYRNEDPRPYVDCDLLVAPDHLDAAESTLRALGFVPSVDLREMPSWWQEHAVDWLREADGALVDVHQTVPGVGVDVDRLWLTLMTYEDTIPVAGFDAHTVTLPARAFLLVIHAAHHGIGWTRVLADLEKAVSTVDTPTWREAAQLARSLDAEAAFGTGLRLTARGREVASTLSLPQETSVQATLKAATPPSVAMGFEQLSQAKGVRARLEILRYKLVPPRTFMTHWSPRAGEGRLPLLWAYVRRPFWLLRHAPAGFRAWREARRRSRS